MLASSCSVTAGSRLTIPCSARVSGRPSYSFSTVSGGRVTVPIGHNIAATSSGHSSSRPSGAASAVTWVLARVARPKASGFCSARMSVSALMLPAQGLLQQHPLGGDQPVLLHRRLDRGQQLIGRDRAWPGSGRCARC